MKIKLFVSDIDGTILVSGKKISKRNIEAVRIMREEGIIFTLATGRMYRAALPIAKELRVNVPIITYNGALIKSVFGEILYENYLPEDLVLEIISFYEERGWHLQVYSEDTLYVPKYNDFVRFYENSQNVKAKIWGWHGIRCRTFKVSKLLGIAENEEENSRRIEEVKENFGDKIEITKSSSIFTEIMAPHVSKASAVKILAKKSQKCLVVMFYSSTFAPAIERDSGDEMLRNIKKLFLKKTLKNIWS